MIFDLSGLLKEGELKIALNRATIDNIFLSALYGDEEDSKISDEELFAQVWENIKRFEDIKYYPYLDSKCNITIASGINVNIWDDFKKLNLTVNKVPATYIQKKEGFERLKEFSRQLGGKNNFKAERFESVTNLRIPEEEVRKLSETHIKNDLIYLRKEFSEFDSFPRPLKEILLDIKYNTKEFKRENWPNLYNAIEKHDVEKIVENVHRKDIGQERNKWAENLARSIRF